MKLSVKLDESVSAAKWLLVNSLVCVCVCEVRGVISAGFVTQLILLIGSLIHPSLI